MFSVLVIRLVPPRAGGGGNFFYFPYRLNLAKILQAPSVSPKGDTLRFLVAVSTSCKAGYSSQRLLSLIEIAIFTPLLNFNLRVNYF